MDGPVSPVPTELQRLLPDIAAAFAKMGEQFAEMDAELADLDRRIAALEQRRAEALQIAIDERRSATLH